MLHQLYCICACNPTHCGMISNMSYSTINRQMKSPMLHIFVSYLAISSISTKSAILCLVWLNAYRSFALHSRCPAMLCDKENHIQIIGATFDLWTHARNAYEIKWKWNRSSTPKFCAHIDRPSGSHKEAIDHLTHIKLQFGKLETIFFHGSDEK